MCPTIKINKFKLAVFISIMIIIPIGNYIQPSSPKYWLPWFSRNTDSNYLKIRTTNLLLDYDGYVLWSTNITITVLYWHVETADNITGATLNATIIRIEDEVNGDIWDASNWTGEFGDFTGNITVYPETSPGEGYIVTMNTTWLPRNLKLIWQFNANKTGYANSSTTCYIKVRDVKSELEITACPVKINTDIVSHFNITLNYWDRDNNSLIRNDTSDPRYEGIKFWVHDDYSDGDNYTHWGRNFSYGQFLVTYWPIQNYYNISFYFDTNVSDQYTIRIRANGKHLGGPIFDEEYTEESDNITFNFEKHYTNITINPQEIVDGEIITPQVLEFEDYAANNVIIYGERVNVSFFWYDLNSSEYLHGIKNQSGVPKFGSINLTTKFPLAGIMGEIPSLLYTVYYMYNITGGNPSYKGVYNLEIRTDILKALLPLEDVIYGGPFNNGTYNLTINIHYDFPSNETKYLHTSKEIWLHILPINTSLVIDRFELQSNQEISEPIIPFGMPGSNYYFNIYLNYTTNTSEPLLFAETCFLEIWNGTNWKPWEFGKFEYLPGISHRLRIYTYTVDTALIPWNSSGFKNVTLRITFNRTNYITQRLVQTVFLRKHRTQIQWCDELTYEPIDPLKINDTTYYQNPEFKIFFRYVDLDNINDSIPTYSGSEKYISYAYVNITGWNKDWVTICETSTPGLYELILQINYNEGTYNFTILTNDTHPLGYRNATSVTFYLLVVPKNYTESPNEVPILIILNGKINDERSNFLIISLSLGIIGSIAVGSIFAVVLYKRRSGRIKRTSVKIKKIKLTEQSIEEAQKYFGQGVLFLRSENYQKAIIYFKKAVEINPNFKDALIFLGSIYMASESYAKAIEYYEKVVVLAPDDKKSWKILGLAYNNISNYQKAIECYKIALEIEPNDKDILNNMVSSYGKIGNHQKVIECSEAVLKIDPTDQRAWHNLGIGYAQLGNYYFFEEKNYEKSTEFYRQAVIIDPKLKVVWKNLAVSFTKLGKYQKAIECNQKIIELDPNAKDSWKNMGKLYVKMNNYQKAIECYNKAVEIDPQDMNALTIIDALKDKLQQGN